MSATTGCPTKPYTSTTIASAPSQRLRAPGKRQSTRPKTRPCSTGSTHPQQQGLVLRQPTECRRPGAYRRWSAICIGLLLAAGRLSESAAVLGTTAAGCEQADCCNPVEPACAARPDQPFSAVSQAVHRQRCSGGFRPKSHSDLARVVRPRSSMGMRWRARLLPRPHSA